MGKDKIENKGLYTTLNVATDAKPEQIKKAYFRLARECHPDKGGCADKFKIVKGAYEVLMDPNKRKLYDAYGLQGLKQGGCAMFGRAGVNRAMYQRQKRGENLRHNIKVKLGEFYNGSVRTLQLTKDRICQGCKGIGGSLNGAIVCSKCGGRGVVLKQIGLIQRWQTCSDCNGTGKRINPKFICKLCKGKRVQKVRKLLEVKIEKGMKGGHKMKFHKEANESPGYVPGDVVIVLEEQESKTFKRNGVHLHMKKSISLMEALGGFKFTIRHLDNRLLVISSRAGVIYRPGYIEAIRDEGMPVLRDPFSFGNLYIQFEVTFPTSVSAKDLEILAKIFPVPRIIETPADAQAVSLVAVNMAEEKKRYAYMNASRKNAYDEDSDEEPPKKPECTTQ